ncbi:LPXTG-motif cell wall-anchored protein [Neomicrococcus aestuarii]|uniref:LPXTG-motif cell wall-anchored protein n=1 Tax=Neomicrococcus aestuarii TaxID=556325 RepID=A0A7W8X1B0_9MICC|nr:LPXTG cell wall anchor domain-containing protein [Neomicrococcus aestuarii]MBB5512584.1 LPXTG-motif cell wall-anchored protein [Neomicrococcus aestuarii]
MNGTSLATTFRTTALSAMVATGLLLSATPAHADDLQIFTDSAQSSSSTEAVVLSPVLTPELSSENPDQLDSVSALAAALGEPEAAVEASSSQVPAEESVVGETPVVESPAVETPADEAPVEVAPTEEAPVTEVPTEAPTSEDPVVPTDSSSTESEPTASDSTESATSTDQPVVVTQPTPTDPADETGTEGGGVVPEESEEIPSHHDMPTFFETYPEIEAPAGSEAWDSEDWAAYFETAESEEFQQAFFGAYLNSDAAAYVDDLTFFFTETSDLNYIYEMFDFLDGYFPEHPGLADGMFYVVANMLVDAGYLEWNDGDDFPSVPSVPTEPGEPTEPSEPGVPTDPTVPGEPSSPSDPTTEPEPGEVPVVNPVPGDGETDATDSPTSTPAPSSEPTDSPSAGEELASTGVSGTAILGAGGVMLVAAGLVLMRVRRRLS